MIGDQLDLLAEGRKARDEGMAQVEESSDQLAKDSVDHLIRTFAERGEKFSANDIRPHLIDVRPQLVGARFMAASKRQIIRAVGLVASTDKGTHAHRITVWEGIDS